jgi:hypothetical protein
VQSTLCVGGRDRKLFASATCSSQFAKASAAMLPQQEKNNSADVQLGIVNISGFILTVESYSSRRRSFDEFLSLAVALHWANHSPCACLCRWRLRRKTSA